MNDVIRVLIADDHPLVREALRAVLDKQQDCEVVAEVGDGEMAVRLANELNPNVVIMDITMPKIDGLEATRQIKAARPDIGILVLTVHDDEEFMLNILQAGADGYLIKSVLGSEVVSAVRAVVVGEMVLTPAISRRVLTYAYKRFHDKAVSTNVGDGLTFREMETLRLLAKGASNKDIALELGLSLRTVKGYLLTLFARLNARSRTEAIVIGLRTGILTIEDLME